MIATTTLELRVKLSGAVTTNECPITGHFVSMTDTGIVTATRVIHTITAGTSPVVIVPVSFTGINILKNLQVYNSDTATATVIIEQHDLATGIIRTVSSTPLTTGQYLIVDANWNATVLPANIGGGTVTQVQGNGTVNGLTLSGNVTTSGNLTLGGTLSGTASGLTAGNVTNIPNLSGVITGNSTGTTTLTANGTNSAGVAAWVSDETGSGSLVFATSPNLTTPALGTPGSGDLTNCTADWLSLGWIALGACTYESADSPTFQFSIAADVTGFISVGDRIKLTQTTVKYFLVTAVGAYTAGKTIITVYGGTDYTLANAAITSPFYSIVKAPFGFPMAAEKWTVTVTDTSLRTQTSPTAGTWYNPGSLSISVPIGSWEVDYETSLYLSRSSANVISGYTTLSTASNTESDSSMSDFLYRGVFGATGNLVVISKAGKRKSASYTSKTTLYLNCKSTLTTLDSISFDGSDCQTVIRAKSALL